MTRVKETRCGEVLAGKRNDEHCQVPSVLVRRNFFERLDGMNEEGWV